MTGRHPGRRVTLPRNAPTQVGEVTVAASNIWEEEGAMTAHLWVRHDSATHAKLRVKVGQELLVPGGRIRVTAIGKSGVEIEVEQR